MSDGVYGPGDDYDEAEVFNNGDAVLAWINDPQVGCGWYLCYRTHPTEPVKRKPVRGGDLAIAMADAVEQWRKIRADNE